MEVSSSILNVDNKNYIESFYRLETAHVDYFHIDVMDGDWKTLLIFHLVST